MCPNYWPSWQHLPVVNCHSTPQRYRLTACLHDSIWVHLCAGSSNHPGVAHRSVVCYLQHQVPSCSHIEFLHLWEESMADLWGSKGASDPGVPNSVLTCISALPLPTARWDSQHVGNDRGYLWQENGPGGGVHERTQKVQSKPHCK